LVPERQVGSAGSAGASAGPSSESVRTSAGPTAIRIVVGTHLRRLREARGVSRDAAADTIRASAAKISRLESGRSPFKIRDLTDLLDLYGVDDTPERARLLALVDQANARGWWHQYGDVVEQWFQTYIGLEQASSLIRTYQPQFVPGLLQTEAYTRAVVDLGHPDEPAERRERRVALRVARQQLLEAAHAPTLWTVIDEAALSRPVGGTAVLRAQIRHLLDISERPNVTVQVVPFHLGGHGAIGGPFNILRFPEPELPDIVYLEQLTSALYLDRPEDTYHYQALMDRLCTDAETPAQSRVSLDRAMHRFI